ncbi:lamin tail domain-containing protein [Paraliomyxa miuraensis]|uniref:lamin tail domain-containing protein n=1 Tax=Paraliomyxa miuraensis TaxID=376150 RepID=UPI00225AB0E2|nr:lamin tail domain-containing protein [Paraliomyxa miuraensis]MCX4243451.1 lamin tail domain-containing protein [Paraliomyxa miuraensis]
MISSNAERIRMHALGWVLCCTACTAVVADDDPFATVGMSGTSASSATADATDTATADATDTATAGTDGTDASGSADSGGSDSADSGSDDASTATDTASDDCNPACDPQTSVCEGGQCVPPGPPLPGQVVITELMPNPVAVTDDDGEWIELVNVGTDPVDLEGCVLYDDASDEDVVNSGVPVVVPPGGVVVFAKVADAALNGGVAGVAYAFGTSFTLANTGDEVRLECGGAVIDEVAYIDTWPFAEGVAMQLSSASLDATANDAPASWCAATSAYGLGDLGTPGQANAGC